MLFGTRFADESPLARMRPVITNSGGELNRPARFAGRTLPARQSSRTSISQLRPKAGGAAMRVRWPPIRSHLLDAASEMIQAPEGAS